MKLKSLTARLAALLCACGFAFSAWADLPGSGTEADPYTISSLAQLKEFRDSVNASATSVYMGKYVRLDVNVDLNNEQWTPIGNTMNTPLNCIFDGNGNTISNLYINDSSMNIAGFIGATSYATVKNLKVHNANLTGNDYVGAIAGRAYAVTTVQNCEVSGSIRLSGNHYVGGITGSGYATVTGCKTIGDGVATSYIHGADAVANAGDGDDVGGIIGLDEGGTSPISDCYVSDVTIEGFRQVGGIAGLIQGGRPVVSCSVKDVVVKCIADQYTVDNKAARMAFGGIVGAISQTGGGSVTGCTVENVQLVSDPVGVSVARMGYISGGYYTGADGFLIPDRLSSTITGADNTVINVVRATEGLQAPAVPNIVIDGPVAVAQIVRNDAVFAQYETLAAAFGAAQGGDTVELLSDVTWDGSNEQSKNYTITVTGPVTFDGKGHTVSAPSGSMPEGIVAALTFGDTSWTQVNDYVYTVTNATFSGFSGLSHGVLRCQGVTANVIGCTFTDNASNTGWGVVSSSHANLNVKDCVFSGTTSGKCIDFGSNGNNANDITLSVDNCRFNNNQLNGSGVIYVAGSIAAATIGDCSFSGNAVASDGAAVVYCSSTTEVTGCLFMNNTVTVSGSGNKCGVLALGSGATNSVFTENAFVDNTTTYEGGSKATVYVGATGVDLADNYWGDGAAPETGNGSDIYIASGKSATYATYASSYEVIGNGVTVTRYVPQVAQIGTTKYATLAAAILAAQDGDTIEILDGTWGADAVGTMTTQEALSVRAKSLTIQAASGATPKFTADVSLGYDDSTTKSAAITVKGLAFENASLMIGNYAQTTVQNCSFEGSSSNKDFAAALAIKDSCCSNYNRTDFVVDQVTISNCTFNGTEDGKPAVRVRDSGNVSITGNTVLNANHNGITFESNKTVNNNVAKTVVIQNNRIEEWNVGNVTGGGRGIRLDLGEGGLAAGSTVTVSGNVLRKGTLGLGNDTPDFMKITNAGSATVNLSGNDWNDMLLSEVLGNGAIYTCDAATTTLTSVITTKKEPVAQIGETKYETLLSALENATSGTTVELLSDVDEDINPIPALQNVTLDFCGHTVTGQLKGAYDKKINGFVVKNGSIVGRNSSRWANLQIANGSKNVVVTNMTLTTVRPNVSTAGYAFYNQSCSSIPLQDVVADGRFYVGNSGSIIAIESGTYRNTVGAAHAIEANGVVAATGGTFYYNPTTPRNLVADGYVATETTDAENVQCWIIERGPSLATITLADGTETEYWNINEAFGALEAGSTLAIKPGEYTLSAGSGAFGSYSLPPNVTIIGAGESVNDVRISSSNRNGPQGLILSGSGITVSNIYFKAEQNGGSALVIRGSGTVVDCVLDGMNDTYHCESDGMYQGIVNGTLHFLRSSILAERYAINVGETSGEVIIEDCTVKGWSSFGSGVKVTVLNTIFIEGDVIGESSWDYKGPYNDIRFYDDAFVSNCTFNAQMNVDVCYEVRTGIKLIIADSTYQGEGTLASRITETDKGSSNDAVTSHDIVNDYVAVGTDVLLNENGEIVGGLFDVIADELIADGYTAFPVENNKLFVGTVVAKIGDIYYRTFAEAIDAADAALAETGVDPVIEVIDATAEQGNPNWKIDGDKLVRKAYVAQIGSAKYESLADAIAAVQDDDTIELLSDTTVAAGYAKSIGESGYGEGVGANRLVISTDKTFTVDLGGHVLMGRINFARGNMTLVNGTIRASSQALNIFGSKDYAYAGEEYSVITIGADVTVDANYGLCVFAGDPGNTYYQLGFGEVFNVYGKVRANSPVYVSGNVGRASEYTDDVKALENTTGKMVYELMALYGPKINIYDGAELVATPSSSASDNSQGISLSGCAIVNVFGGTVSGAEGIGVKGGVLNVSGGTIKGTGAKCDPVLAVNSGTEASGAAISASTHYNQNYSIAINVTGGTITSVNNAAFLVAHSVEGGTPEKVVNGIYAVIAGGRFAGGAGQDAVIVETALEGEEGRYPANFISGGFFSTKVPANYIVEDKLCTTKADFDGFYTIVPAKTVTFTNGDTTLEVTLPSNFSYPEGDPVDRVLEKPTYESSNTTFVGWKDAQNNTWAKIPAGTDQDLVLTATWESARVVPVSTTVVETTPTVKVTESWVAENNIQTEGKSEEEVVAAITQTLAANDTNGLQKWQNYVLGQDKDNHAAVVAAKDSTEPTVAELDMTFDVPAIDTGFDVTYRLDEVDADGETVTEGTKESVAEIDLEAATGESGSAYFQVKAVLTPKGEGGTEKAVEVNVEKTVGVVKVDSAAEWTIVAVPWESLGTGAIKASELIHLGNRSNGDELRVYTAGAYQTWKLQDGNWVQPTRSFKATKSGSQENSVADAGDVSIPRGAGVWLKRVDPTAPIYLLGQKPTSTETVETTLEKPHSEAAEGTKAWNLVASPNLQDVDVATLLNGRESTDKIIVPTAGAPKNYTYENGQWGYDGGEVVETEVTMPNGVKIKGFRPVRITNDKKIPAGTGFWYLNGDKTDTENKINW